MYQKSKYVSDFASGALSSLASSLYGGSGFKNAEGNFIQQSRGLNGIIGGGDFGTLAFGTVMGGAGAKLSGGNFWQGAATGLVVSGLNHYVHQQQEKHEFFDRLRTHYEGKSGDDFNLTTKEFKYLIKKGVINYAKAVKVDDNTYKASINFYDSDSDLKLSFGRATITYRIENDKYIYSTFYDKYDFDSKPWGTRSVVNEVITRAYNSYSDGKSFNIYYNKK